MARQDNKIAQYALILILILIGFFIGLLIGGSGGYFLSPGSGGKVVEKTVTKYQCANGNVVDDSKKCPNGNITAVVCPPNQTKYVFRNETVFQPCNCLRDCGVDRPSMTTTTLPQKPKVICRSDRDCGSTNTTGIRCSSTLEAYRLLITPKCLIPKGETEGYCAETQSKEVIRQCGAENSDELCQPEVGCVVLPAAT